MAELSVLLPVHNASLTLRLSIESVLAQSFRDFELLIIDDGSCDCSLEIVRQYALMDSRVQFRARENRGLGSTLNELLGWATGRFFARMDADDVATPNRFEDQLRFLKMNKDVVLVGGQIAFLVSGGVLPSPRMPSSHAAIVRELERGRFSLCHPAVMVRTKAALDIGGYKPWVAGEDLDFFLRLSEKGALANVDDEVLLYRILPQSLSSSRSYDLVKGYRLAVLNYRRRKAGLPEFQDKDEVADAWIVPIYAAFRRFSERNYRSSLIARVQGRNIVAILCVVLAAMSRPKSALRRMLALFSRVKRS